MGCRTTAPWITHTEDIASIKVVSQTARTALSTAKRGYWPRSLSSAQQHNIVGPSHTQFIASPAHTHTHRHTHTHTHTHTQTTHTALTNTHIVHTLARARRHCATVTIAINAPAMKPLVAAIAEDHEAAIIGLPAVAVHLLLHGCACVVCVCVEENRR